MHNLKRTTVILAVLACIVGLFLAAAHAAPCPCRGGQCPSPSFSYSFDTSMPVALPAKSPERPYAPPSVKPVVAPTVSVYAEPAASEVKRKGPRRPIVRAVAKTPKAIGKALCGLAKIRPLTGLGRLLARNR